MSIKIGRCKQSPSRANGGDDFKVVVATEG
jgi:hypothetical protein